MTQDMLQWIAIAILACLNVAGLWMADRVLDIMMETRNGRDNAHGGE